VSDIFVLPSQYEGLPVALLESMACGKTVLVSECDGNLHIVQNGSNGLTFAIDDEDHLASQLKQLLDNPRLRQELGQNAHTTILEHYSMAYVTQEHSALYRSLLEKDAN
jgi:glycosyltransferase involved in cell wall biosynthesis